MTLPVGYDQRASGQAVMYFDKMFVMLPLRLSPQRNNWQKVTGIPNHASLVETVVFTGEPPSTIEISPYSILLWLQTLCDEIVKSFVAVFSTVR